MTPRTRLRPELGVEKIRRQIVGVGIDAEMLVVSEVLARAGIARYKLELSFTCFPAENFVHSPIVETCWHTVLWPDEVVETVSASIARTT